MRTSPSAHPKWVDVYAHDLKVSYGVFTPYCVESIAHLPELTFLIFRDIGSPNNSPEALRYRVNALHRSFGEALARTDRFVQSSELMVVDGRLDLMICVEQTGQTTWTALRQKQHLLHAGRIY